MSLQKHQRTILTLQGSLSFSWFLAFFYYSLFSPSSKLYWVFVFNLFPFLIFLNLWINSFKKSFCLLPQNKFLFLFSLLLCFVRCFCKTVKGIEEEKCNANAPLKLWFCFFLFRTCFQYTSSLQWLMVTLYSKSQ